jgi:hypothetical protein
MSWNVTVNVVGGEARVFSQSGDLPAESSIVIAGHEDDSTANLSVSLMDALGQKASAGNFTRKTVREQVAQQLNKLEGADA